MKQRFFVFALKTSFWDIRKKIFFLPEPVNSFASDWLEEKFLTVQNCPKKMENHHLIKLVTNRKRAIRKGHANFFGFNFWNFKLLSLKLLQNLKVLETMFFYWKMPRYCVGKIRYVKLGVGGGDGRGVSDAKWGGGSVVKVEPKVQTLGTCRFRKGLNFSKILKTHFLSTCMLPLVKI